MYDYPGVPSISIAYFDTNDFYFSGHIGSCSIYAIELFALGHKKLSLVATFIIINQWFYLTFTRSHFIIDLVSGLVVGLTCHRMGELACYFSDVLVFRFQKHRRQPFWYNVCARCGWNVNDAA